MLLKGGAQ
ncbi:unnamed protein product, partial [Allacma fusca]